MKSQNPPNTTGIVSGRKAAARQSLAVRGGWLVAVLALTAAAAAAGFLLTSSRLAGLGFPLDDAWIHQTYARNLALRGEWAFIPGQPSAGSTAPLWSALLAVGYLLRLPYLGWAYLLGSLSLLGLAWFGEKLFRAYRPDVPPAIPWAGLFLVGEWHLVWAAVSGMETLLFGLFILLVLWQTARAGERARAWGLVGLLIGLSMWIRPDGITLLGPAGFTLLLASPGWRARGRGLLWLAGGAALLVVPYLLFNLLVQGSIWPNTFYAKQAEYAVYRQLPLLSRFFSEISLPLIGSGVFLLPGLAWFSIRAGRARSWPALGALIWFLGYGLLYALRLPVTYQYGRYFMPAMPVYFILGLAGSVDLIRWLRPGRLRWLLGRVAVISAGVVWLAFYVIGAGRYAQDVGIIETEMVAAARWVAANTPANAVIAAHDIGAMGYFGQRRILDLAGLVSPEVIPFIRDEARLARWLDAQNTDYLVVLDGWYSHLPDGKPLVFKGDYRFTVNSGSAIMKIYRWR